VLPKFSIPSSYQLPAFFRSLSINRSTRTVWIWLFTPNIFAKKKFYTSFSQLIVISQNCEQRRLQGRIPFFKKRRKASTHNSPRQITHNMTTIDVSISNLTATLKIQIAFWLKITMWLTSQCFNLSTRRVASSICFVFHKASLAFNPESLLFSLTTPNTHKEVLIIKWRDIYFKSFYKPEVLSTCIFYSSFLITHRRAPWHF